MRHIPSDLQETLPPTTHILHFAFHPRERWAVLGFLPLLARWSIGGWSFFAHWHFLVPIRIRILQHTTRPPSSAKRATDTSPFSGSAQKEAAPTVPPSLELNWRRHGPRSHSSRSSRGPGVAGLQQGRSGEAFCHACNTPSVGNHRHVGTFPDPLIAFPLQT